MLLFSFLKSRGNCTRFAKKNDVQYVRTLQLESLERRELLTVSQFVGPSFEIFSTNGKEVPFQKSHIDLYSTRIYGPLWSEFVSVNVRETLSCTNVHGNCGYSLRECSLAFSPSWRSELPSYEEYIAALNSVQEEIINSCDSDGVAEENSLDSEIDAVLANIGSCSRDLTELEIQQVVFSESDPTEEEIVSDNVAGFVLYSRMNSDEATSDVSDFDFVQKEMGNRSGGSGGGTGGDGGGVTGDLNLPGCTMTLRNLNTTISYDSNTEYLPILESHGLDSSSNFSVFNLAGNEYAEITLPNFTDFDLPRNYGMELVLSGSAQPNVDYVVLTNTEYGLQNVTGTGLSGGENIYLVPINDGVLELDENIVLSIYLIHAPSSGGTIDRYLKDSLTITIVDSNPEVSVSWVRDGDGAPLDTNPQGGGLRIYPEEKIVETNGHKLIELQNTVQVKFQLDSVAIVPTTVYYKVIDPDNHISLGRDQQTDNLNEGNDNYLTSLIKEADNTVDIPENLSYNQVYFVTIPAGSSYTMITIKFDEAYAGDNFIVVADTISSNVTNVTLGTHKTDRYLVVSTLNAERRVSQTSLLTVWRSLNMELGQMQAPTIPTVEEPSFQEFVLDCQYNDGCYTGSNCWDITVPNMNANNTNSPSEPVEFDLLTQPDLPDVSLLSEVIETACITVKVLSEEDIKFLSEKSVLDTAPFKHYLELNNTTDTGRNISVSKNTSTFWLIYALGAYELSASCDFDGENVWEIGYAAPTTLLVYNEVLRDFLTTGIPSNANFNLVDVVEGKRRIVLHETLHYFLGPHATLTGNNEVLDFGDVTNIGIMNKNHTSDDYYLYTSGSFELTTEQIRVIQSKLVNLQRVTNNDE